MKKIVGLVLAASLALGVLTVAGPATAEEEGTGNGDGPTVTIYYNDVQDKIVDVDLNNGYGVTYNTDTGDSQFWQQDEDGNWSEIDAPGHVSNGIAADDNWEAPSIEEDGE